MRKLLTAAAGLVATLALTGTAWAAVPTVSTGSTTQLTSTSVTLKGTVNPQGLATTTYFQYGKTKAYGAQTGPVNAGAGTKGVPVEAALVGLTPNTTYHYRVVATNTSGATVGTDKSFTTSKQPLGFTLAASPNPVLFNGPTTITGQLTGTGSASKGIQLQSRAFPYTGSFANTGNAQVADATGKFSFPVLALTGNTQYRVVTTGAGSITSPVVLVGAQVIIRVSHQTSVKKGQLVRFAGTVTPKNDGALYALQKQKGSLWVTVGGSSLKPYAETKSRFAIRTRVQTSGTYRIFVGVANGQYTSGATAGTAITLKKSS